MKITTNIFLFMGLILSLSACDGFRSAKPGSKDFTTTLIKEENLKPIGAPTAEGKARTARILIATEVPLDHFSTEEQGELTHKTPRTAKDMYRLVFADGQFKGIARDDESAETTDLAENKFGVTEALEDARLNYCVLNSELHINAEGQVLLNPGVIELRLEPADVDATEKDRQEIFLNSTGQVQRIQCVKFGTTEVEILEADLIRAVGAERMAIEDAVSTNTQSAPKN